MRKGPRRAPQTGNKSRRKWQRQENKADGEGRWPHFGGGQEIPAVFAVVPDLKRDTFRTPVADYSARAPL